jgi:hypothetical protein
LSLSPAGSGGGAGLSGTDVFISAASNVSISGDNVDLVGNSVTINGSPIGGYGNSNVSAFMASFGSNTISTTGNISGGNFITGGLVSTGTFTATSSFAANTIIVTGGTITSSANVDIKFAPATGANVVLDLGGTQFVTSTSSLNGGNIQIKPASTGTLLSWNQQLQTFREKVEDGGNQSGTITPDFNLGSIHYMTLNGNITMNSLANVQTGSSMTLVMKQDATGNRLLTSSMKFAGANKTLSTAGNAIDIISIFYDGTNYYASLTTGYA